MVDISYAERGSWIKIQNDKTFGDVTIHFRDCNHADEMVVKIIKEVLKNED